MRFVPGWFESYRQAYGEWWERTRATIDDDELAEDFEAYREPDRLQPIGPNELAAFHAAFPELPEAVSRLLSELGVGSFFFPSHEEGDEPITLNFFSLKEAQARVESIAEHATRELEELEELGPSCSVHGEDGDKCRALLEAVRTKPNRFYPVCGPDDVYDFVYVLCGSPHAARVARWYHDYPVCELLDGSYEGDPDYDNLEAFGSKLRRLIETGDEYPV